MLNPTRKRFIVGNLESSFCRYPIYKLQHVFKTRNKSSQSLNPCVIQKLSQFLMCLIKARTLISVLNMYVIIKSIKEPYK